MNNMKFELDAPQFQQADAKDVVIPKIKLADNQVLIKLILPFFQAKLVQQQYDVVITDLGCGEGNMIELLLKTLYDTLEDYLLLRIKIFGCEKEPELVEKYKCKFDPPSKEKHLSIIKKVNITQAMIEEYQPNQSDLFLFSHSMYYPQTLWNTQKFPEIQFEQHLLTRYLKQLTQNGIIAVILQSGKTVHQEDSQNFNTLANNEQFEDFFFPKRMKIENKDVMANKENPNFVNAEIFLQCYEKYSELYSHSFKNNLEVQHESSLAIIEIGKLNFNSYDEIHNVYPQSESIMSFLNFYTRGYFQKFSREEQHEILMFLKNNCLRADDVCIMCHPNTVFIIAPASNFKNIAKLCSSETIHLNKKN